MSRIRTTALLALVAVAVSLVAAVSIVWTGRAPAFHGTDVGAGMPASDFTLRTAGGQPVSLAELRGQAVVLFFGYTSCPDICPLTMSKLEQVTERLGPLRDRVRVLLISVDPAVDTPDRVAEYAARFDPSFIGLSGDRDSVARVARDYGVYASEPSDAPAQDGHEGHASAAGGGATPPARLIAHSSYVFGIAPSGDLRLLWSGDATAEEIAADLRVLVGS